MTSKHYPQSVLTSSVAALADRQSDTGLPHSDYFLATVVSSEAGRSQQVAALDRPQQPLSVVSQSLQVPALQVGDPVLALYSRDGVVVMAAMLAPGAIPPAASVVQQADDGSLLIAAEKGLTLQTGNTRINLAADGQLTIEAGDIHSVARGVNQISGARVKLN